VRFLYVTVSGRNDTTQLAQHTVTGGQKINYSNENTITKTIIADQDHL